ncbi:MAG: glycerol-3-phosphate dehydrogenase, partial [Rubrivivax sp.]|nr:glycerol-3-phosphate dehydrogenase [Rubrivivax sp.]
RTSRWSDTAVLPGGDLRSLLARSTRPDEDIERFDAELARAHPELPTVMRRRWVRSYGARVSLLLASPLGAEVAPGLHEGELQHLHEAEWARSADDVLWRRSKLGLHYTPAERQRVADWWQRHVGAAAAAAAAGR